MLINAGSWLLHLLAFRGQYNVVLNGMAGTEIHRGGFHKQRVLDVLPKVEAQQRASEIAAAIEQGVYNPWGRPTAM